MSALSTLTNLVELDVSWNAVPLSQTDTLVAALPKLCSQKRGGYDTDAVGPTVRGRTAVDDDCVQKIAAEVVLQPCEVRNIRIGYRPAELHFERNNSAIASLDDHVDLMTTAMEL